mmetsp:Transcript_15357/g.50221  ORF Transcript_15357/g.50221 Transcript_15357/m.50221 type:complete len:128 (+) Transcript_15357:36-419(+)
MQGRRLASEKDYGGKRPCPICGKQIAREFLAGHADRCFAKSFEGDKKSHDEVTRLRGGWQRITSRALDDVKGLPEAVEAVDARLRDMPEGTYECTSHLVSSCLSSQSQSVAPVQARTRTRRRAGPWT